MDPALRRAFNAAFTPALYDSMQRAMNAQLGSPAIEFRLAETPVLLSHAMRDRIEHAAREIVARMDQPEVVAACEARIPERFCVPGRDGRGRDALPQMMCLDFALTRDAAGEIAPRLIECQAFPSLFAMQVVQSDIWIDHLRHLPGLDRDWSICFPGLTRAGYVDLLRRTVVGDCDPREVVLVDLEPEQQKTRPDFIATERLLGVRAVDLRAITRQGQRLFAPLAGRSVPVRRIYNRVIFDELVARKVAIPDWMLQPHDAAWVPHPNWYWIWSKATLPLVDHPAVPRSRYLADVDPWPRDLARYVLKPLYSFSGHGVKVDVDRATLDAVPAAERRDWLLMEKIDYAPALLTPSGAGVKVELRVLCLRPDGERALRPAANLCRLSRGKMHGVDYNKDFDWVGSSVAVW